MNHSLKEMLEYKKILETNNIFSFFLCPAFCYLPLMHSKSYQLCAQNVSFSSHEKFTGAISVSALKSLDVHSVLIGHHETGDSFSDILQKVSYVTSHFSRAFVILSDTEEDFSYQYTSVRLLEQIHEILQVVPKEQYSLLTFIYEPYWVIGSENPVNFETINNIFYQVKTELAQEYSISFPLFYGGGLTSSNIPFYFTSKYIDGLLLGSLSNDANEVVKLLQNFNFSTGLDKSIHS